MIAGAWSAKCLTPHHPLLIEPFLLLGLTNLGARAAATFLTNMNLFFGQPKEFFAILEAMADEADAAFREV